MGEADGAMVCAKTEFLFNVSSTILCREEVVEKSPTDIQVLQKHMFGDFMGFSLFKGFSFILNDENWPLSHWPLPSSQKCIKE